MLRRLLGETRTLTGMGKLSAFREVGFPRKADSQGRCIPPCAAPRWNTTALRARGNVPNSDNEMSEFSIITETEWDFPEPWTPQIMVEEGVLVFM